MTAPLTFGYLYDFRNPAPWRKPWADLYAQILDFAPWTERLGFSGAWVPEHHGSDDGYMPSPLVALSAIAARTKTLKIGSAVALAPLHHPVRFAEDAAVVDIVSGGRLEVAVALGYRRRETNAFGIDFKTRVSRMNEFLEIVRRLWAGETFSYEGRHYNLTDTSISPRPLRGHIPLLVGGFSEKALARAARLGDGYFGSLDVCDLYRAQVQACGKDPAAAKIYLENVFVLVAEDPEKAMAELGPYYHYVNNVYGEWLTEDQYDNRIDLEHAPKTLSLDAFKASGILRILTPDQAIEMYRAMLEKAPVEHVMLMVPPGLPLDRFARYAEVFANEVIPAFR